MWDLDSLFLEAKTIQEKMRRTKSKQSVHEYKEFDKQLNEKISNAIQSLTEEAKCGVPSLTDEVDKKQSLMFYARNIR